MIACHLHYPRYLVTDAGEVLSLISGAEKALKPIRRGKYWGFTLAHRNGGIRPVYLHRIVCETFHGAPSLGQEVRHRDGDRSNNAAENLEWGTKSQNMRDKERHGTAPIGERHGGAKLTELQVRMIRQFEEVGVPRALVRQRYVISPMNHSRIIRRQLWRHVP